MVNDPQLVAYFAASIVSELKALGTLVRLEYLRTAPNKTVGKAVEIAIDNINNCGMYE
jgi:hypothetical protein